MNSAVGDRRPVRKWDLSEKASKQQETLEAFKTFGRGGKGA